MWWEVITEALLDTVILLPFLLLLYILIELMEHNTRIGKPNGALCGKFAPLLGSVTGLVPMCGFSVMAAKLYRHRHLTLGTLIAVFVATSDEAFIVLLLSDLSWLNKLVSILALCGSKILLGAAAGYVIDLLSRKRKQPLQALPEPCETHEREEHEEEREHAHGEDGHACEAHGEHGEQGEYSVCEHKHGHRSNLSLYLVSPLLHALKIAAFILVFNLAFGYLFFGIGAGNSEAGEARVVDFLNGSGYWYQPLVCALVGLIPNCAASVVLSETYAIGGIAFGSLLGGLVVNAGLGYAVLFRDVKQWKQSLAVLAGMLAFGIVAGYAANAIGLLIPPIA